MAGGDPSESRTESATAKRREEARKQGQVVLSQELNAAILLLAGLTLLSWTVNNMASQLTDLVRHATEFHEFRQWTERETCELAYQLLQTVGGVLGFFLLGILIIGVGSNIAQIGFRVESELLQIKWERLSPAQGYQKLFSIRSAVRGGWSIAKLTCIVAITIYLVRHKVPLILSASNMSLVMSIRVAWEIVLGIGWAVCGALFVVGAGDFFYQRWQHEEDLMMSRQDIKEEQKQDQGDPQVKSRLRRMQREAAKLRMLQEVPTASVVLTNPTHYAVALRYERGVDQAPLVVAKGEGLLAKRIARIARENGVSVIERKPLARALYASVEVGQEIPDTLFRAVAEILAYVYRLRRAA